MTLAKSRHPRTIPIMWGNRLGWTLSLLSVAAIVLFLRMISINAVRAAPRTDFSRNPESAAVIELPVDPAVVLPSISNSRDSSTTYRLAAEQVLANSFIYEGFARSGQIGDIDDLAAVKTLLQAADSTTARFFDKAPERVITYTNEKPFLDALVIVGRCANRAGLLIQDARPADAMKHYEAGFALGVCLYRERTTWTQLDAGLKLMAANARLIATLADSLGDPDRAAAVRRFDAARITYANERLLPMRRLLSSPDQESIALYVGDVIHFARYAPERMWRIESVLRLGLYRFNAARLGDQRVAGRVIEELTQDSDPLVRLAATRARDLTIEQYRLLR